jgi:hypothetical protein
MALKEGRNGGKVRVSEPGEKTPGAGRPKGSQNRATIVRKWLDLSTEIEKEGEVVGASGKKGTIEDRVVLAQVRRAIVDGDTKAAEFLFDAVFGKIPQAHKVGGDDENPAPVPVQIVLAQDDQDDDEEA